MAKKPDAFTALRCGPITLYSIDAWNVREAEAMVCRFADRDSMRREFCQSYIPAYDDDGFRTKWGFYARLNGEIAGLSLLGINREDKNVGYTGADTLWHSRGKGVAPGSKPALFYLGFELFGLERIETGCHVSNASSKRAIEKTPGFEFSGIFPSAHLNERGEPEDEFRYVIQREDWKRLYDGVKVEVLK